MWRLANSCRRMWSAAESGQVLQRLATVGFEASQLAAAMDLFARQPRRRPNQSYETFVDMMTQSVWQKLLSAAEPYTGKFVAMMSHLERLGLRNPSEKTFAVMAGLLFLCCQRCGVERQPCTQHLLGVYLASVKRLWRTPAYVDRRRGPQEHLLVLDASPTLLQENSPVIYGEAFASEKPVAGPMGLLEVQVVARLIDLRKGANNRGKRAEDGVALAAAPAVPLPLLNGPHTPEPQALLALPPAPAAEPPPALQLGVLPGPPRVAGGWANPAASAMATATTTLSAPPTAAPAPEPVVISDSEAEPPPKRLKGGKTASASALALLEALEHRRESGWSASEEKKNKDKKKTALEAAARAGDAEEADEGTKGGKGKPKEGKGKPEKAKPEKRQKHAAVEAAPGAAEGCDAWWKEKVLAPRVTHAVSGVVRAYITGTTRSRPKRSLIVELTQRNTPRYLEIVTEWQEKIKKQKVTKEMAKQWRSELLDGLKG